MRGLQALPNVLFALLLMTCSGCASTSALNGVRAEIASIWERLTTETGRNDEQDIQLTRLERNVIQLTLSDDFLFAFGSSKIGHDGLRNLEKVATVLRDYPEVTITVAGHTDSVGSEQLNLRLSEKRAQTVADVLSENGVSGESIKVTGYGESQPLVSNTTANGRRRNRRVEISLAEGNNEPYVRGRLKAE